MSDLFSETSRVRAVLVNSGANSLEEADAKLNAFGVSIVIGRDAAATQAGQAAFLTAVATAARSFGRVEVVGALAAPLSLPMPLGQQTLGAAAMALGAQLATAPTQRRVISIGASAAAAGPWTVQALWDGWTAIVRPHASEVRLGEDFALTGVVAGAIAVGQAFFAECGDVLAGKREFRLSLWDPCGLETGAPAIRDVALPAALWLIGLGNLGQAHLWSLAALPFADAGRVTLFLQDDDIVDRDNWGTSILVKRGHYGPLKTRIGEDWGLARGFQIRRIDRRVDEHERRKPNEPAIALAGIDRMPPRRLLGKPGFEYVIDVGLGANAATFQRLRVNVFDKNLDPAMHFADVEDDRANAVENLLKQPAYQALAATMKDGGCGAAMLAEKSAAAPFVSAIAGALSVAQAIRLANGKAPYQTLTMDVSDPRSRAGALGVVQYRPSIPRTDAA